MSSYSFFNLDETSARNKLPPSHIDGPEGNFVADMGTNQTKEHCQISTAPKYFQLFIRYLTQTPCAACLELITTANFLSSLIRAKKKTLSFLLLKIHQQYIHAHDKSTTAILTLIYLFDLFNKIKQNKTLVEI